MTASNPAELASIQALERMFTAIENNQCFRLEAGAGAGKTYSLIKALNSLIDKKGKSFQKKNQKIACITYTNIAKNEIEARTDNNPLICTETIHSFSWGLLKAFQKELKSYIPQLSVKWPSRIEEAGGIISQEIIYDLGYPTIDANEIHLYHDDVIFLMTKFLEKPKFQTLIKNKFPIIFIDEYQDTNANLASSIIQNLIENNSGILIGLFGDHWQKIYDDNRCGLIENRHIEAIDKNANFRSDKNIVMCLNRMRPELRQEEKDPTSNGDIRVFHTNSWSGQRKSESIWAGDLPAENAQAYFEHVKQALSQSGWNFENGDTKILMLTNKVLAAHQGYENLADCFKESDDYVKKNNSYIKYFLETLEPVCEYFNSHMYGKMFEVFNKKIPELTSHADKVSWVTEMNILIRLRENSTIGEIIEHLKRTNHPKLSPKIESSETRLQEIIDIENEGEMTVPEDDVNFKDKLISLKTVPYKEIVNLYRYVEDKTPFSTKHGVKGAEFNNVLVVLGRGWNKYNWSQMLEWLKNGVPNDKNDTFIRNRNLFYVACSRAKNNLALLFTQKLSDDALVKVKEIFGVENVVDAPIQ